MAQQINTVAVDSFCGLDDDPAANTIGDCNAQSLLNVETNVPGNALNKRPGFSRIATLTPSTAPVKGSAYFKTTGGTEIVVVCYDTKCAASKNGAAFVNFTTTESASAARYSFVDWNGSLYRANDAYDAVWRYDGTSLYPTNIPAVSILALTQDRMIGANTSANPNRTNYSKSGDFNTWATGVNSPDPFNDDLGTPGDQIAGVTYWQGVLYYFKQYSVMGCVPGDQYTTQCVVLTKITGTSDGNSIVQSPDAIYFKGTDQNFWKFDGRNFSIVSLTIQETIKTFASGSTGRNIQTTQADWQAGTQNPNSSWNTTAISGSIFPSSATVADVSTSNFSGGTFSNTNVSAVAASISLSSTVVEDQWKNAATAGRLAWTITSGHWNMELISGVNYLVSENSIDPNNDLTQRIYTSSGTLSSGSWRWLWQYEDTEGGSQCCSPSGTTPTEIGTCSSMDFMRNAGGDTYSVVVREGPNDCTVKRIYIEKTVSGVTTSFTNTGNFSMTKRTPYQFEIVRSTDGRFSLTFNGVFKSSTSVGDVAITSSTAVQIQASRYLSGGRDVYNRFANFYEYAYVSTGTFTSRIFDTGYSTPTWGPFSSTFSAGGIGEGNVAFYVQSSTANDGGGFGGLVSTSDTIRPSALQQRRYVRYAADLATSVSTKTPSIQEVALAAATTGVFASQCIDLPSTISGFGLLTCDTTLAGAGGLVFYSTTAATCGSLPNAFQTGAGQWNSVANGAVPTSSTNTAFAFRFDSLLGSATDQAQVNSCTINFGLGAVPPPAWGVFNPIKNEILWSGTVNNSTSTNRWFKFDLNSMSWWPYDIQAQAPLFYKNSIYFGGGNGGYWNQYAPPGINSDAGSAINSYWISKDWSLGAPFQEKTINSLSLVAKNPGSGSLTVTGDLDGGPTNSFTVNIGTTATTSYIRRNYAQPIASPFTFLNVEFSNNAANNPWSVLGYQIQFLTKPWRVLGPP